MLDPMCGLGTILLEAAKEWPVSITVATGRTCARCCCIRKNLYHSYTKVHYWKAGTKLIVLYSSQKCFSTNVPPQVCKPKSYVLVQSGAGSPAFILHGLCEAAMDF